MRPVRADAGATSVVVALFEGRLIPTGHFPVLPSWLLPGSARSPGASALPLRAHARSRALARRRLGRRLSPPLVAARRARRAPTPTHRTATLGRPTACDAVDR